MRLGFSKDRWGTRGHGDLREAPQAISKNAGIPDVFSFFLRRLYGKRKWANIEIAEDIIIAV